MIFRVFKINRLPLVFLLVVCFILSGCSTKSPHEFVIENIHKLIRQASIFDSNEYSDYIKNLDKWAISEAYDELVVIPDSIRDINYEDDTNNYKPYTEIKINGINIYACFKDVDLEEFSNFYLFDSGEYDLNSTDIKISKNSQAWDEKLSEWFNPNKEHDVRNAVCFIGYGYYVIKVGNIDFRYYLAVKCNKEGKVEKFINNYLGSY